MKIKQITKKYYTGKVYNLGTLPDHNYFVNGILAHNCYQNSTPQDEHYDINKLQDFFGPMTSNERPFSVAIGGGNPNEHPDFIKMLKLLYDLEITPNYTTNGMGLTKEILEATNQYCKGVAISCHEHLTPIWEKAIKDFQPYRSTSKANINNTPLCLNLHIIISDKKSVLYFLDIFKKYHKQVDYFVLLPLINMGRAKDQEQPLNGREFLFNSLRNFNEENISKVAFGAGFYLDLLANPWIPASIYEPEGFSKYIDLKDTPPKVYKSSFNLVETP
jgi:hypothetical protein